MASYVERDGDWVWRPPGRLEDARMWIFVLRAGRKELADLLERWITVPSGGAVTVEPLAPELPFVLLTCARLGRIRSLHPVDAGKGATREHDAGIFVPARLRHGARHSITTFVPYLFVDSFPAVVAGREIYGFPKLLADFTLLDDPFECEVRSLAVPAYASTRPIVERPVLVVRSHGVAPATPVDGSVLEVSRALARYALEALGALDLLQVTGFAKVPQVFLKQFRDAERPDEACHQSVVEADAPIISIRQAHILGGRFEVELPAYDSLAIARTLGISGDPVAAFSLDLAFGIDAGRTIWP